MLRARATRMRTPPSFLLLAAAVVVPFVPACSPPVACLDYAVTSVSINVVDDQGAPVPTAHVTFSIDGGPEQDAECFGFEDPSAGCTEWDAAWEKAGHFV